MAKIDRVYQKQFGSSADVADFIVFGSLAESSPDYTKDPVELQSLSNFLGGWTDAIIADNRPSLEDFNGLFYLLFYQLRYLFQAGIAEWDDETTYYIGSAVQVAGVYYQSLTDDNVGNDPTSDAVNWGPLIPAAESKIGKPILYFGAIADIDSSKDLFCDGSAVSRTTYADLFAVIGTKYGVGDGSTTFNLPDSRNFSLVGANADDSGVAKSTANYDGTAAVTKSNNNKTYMSEENVGSSGQNVCDTPALNDVMFTPAGTNRAPSYPNYIAIIVAIRYAD